MKGAKPKVVRALGAYRAVLMADPCAYCGASAECLDHITPMASGGGHDWQNITATCTSCNNAKGGRSLLAFLGARVNRSAWDAALEQRALWAAVGR